MTQFSTNLFKDSQKIADMFKEGFLELNEIQRRYNWMLSQQVEAISLAPKTPWVTDARRDVRVGGIGGLKLGRNVLPNGAVIMVD